jgi:hypothetical protein
MLRPQEFNFLGLENAESMAYAVAALWIPKAGASGY